MDFCCFYFPLFCIHWLMGDDLLPANPARNAHDIRSDTVGVLAIAQVGRSLGKMADKVSNGAFLWCDAILRKFLFAYILLIINYISFTKLLAQQTCNKNQKNYFPRI